MKKPLIKIFISLALVIFVFLNIDIRALLELLRRVDIFWLFLAFIAFNLSKIVSAIRLIYYLKEIGIEISNRANLILYYIGMFYNLFLPGGIGGDGYKAYILKRDFNKRVSLVLKALVFDRVSGLVALIFLAALLFLFSSFVNLVEWLRYIAIFVAIFIYLAFYFISKRFKLFFRYFFTTSFLGLLVQILQLLSAYFIILALGVDEVIDFLFLFLLSSVVGVLPITIGGVGVRELTFLYGLELIGLRGDIGVAFSLLFFIITLLSSLIGIVFINRAKVEDAKVFNK